MTHTPQARRSGGNPPPLLRLIASLLAELLPCQLLFPLQAFAHVVPAEPESFEAETPFCGSGPYLTPKVGDVVIYTEYQNGGTERQSHAAIVTSVSGSNVYVKSKWAYHAVYSHKVEDCPFWAPMVTHGNNTKGTKLLYYTINHSYILHNGYYQCKGCGHKIPVPANGGVEHEMQ